MWNLSFDTTALAVLQENYEAIYKQGGTITPKQLSDLKKHLWVILASKLSPSNLVIRHWCLIDLFSGSPDHVNKIKKMVDLLSYEKDDNGMRIWAEGGYYFWYTMVILQLWLDKFAKTPDNSSFLTVSAIKTLINKICRGIAETAYLRAGQWYIAPFGDVRDAPMNDMPIGIDLQNIQQQPYVIISVITRVCNSSPWTGTLPPITYKLKARPIRFNLHIPKNDCTTLVIDGIPFVNGTATKFSFYDGWGKKYKSTWAEICDMLSLKRLLSFFSI
jgi:hypothetical protein